MSEEQKIEFWSCEDPELLTHTEMDDAIEDFLGNVCDNPLSAEITVTGYVSMKAVVGHLDNYALEGLLNSLDEIYGGEDFSEATENMRVAAKTFVEAVLAEYTVTACKPVLDKKINVMDWVTEYEPQWLKETPPVEIERLQDGT